MLKESFNLLLGHVHCSSHIPSPSFISFSKFYNKNTEYFFTFPMDLGVGGLCTPDVTIEFKKLTINFFSGLLRLLYKPPNNKPSESAKSLFFQDSVFNNPQFKFLEKT